MRLEMIISRSSWGSRCTCRSTAIDESSKILSASVSSMVGLVQCQTAFLRSWIPNDGLVMWHTIIKGTGGGIDTWQQ